MRNCTTVGSRALRVKIRAGLGHEPGRGSGIHNITNFHDMLLLAVGIRWHAGRILEIELDLFHGLGAMLWSMMATRWIQDTSELAQDAPAGAGGTRKGQALRLQLLISMQVVQNRSGTWCSLDVTSRDLGRGAVMGTRVRKQHLQIIGRSLSQSLQPLAFHN